MLNIATQRPIAVTLAPIGSCYFFPITVAVALVLLPQFSVHPIVNR